VISLNLILLNKKINNQVVKIEHENRLFIVYVRTAIFEDWKKKSEHVFYASTIKTEAARIGSMLSTTSHEPHIGVKSGLYPKLLKAPKGKER
jgi:hypothetical protein